MRKVLRKIAYSTALRPKRVRQSSQTLYETVLGCLALFEATNDSHWRDRAADAAKLIVANQLPDGGFDIGYEFDFGKQRGLKQSTAPECKSVIALSEMHRAQPNAMLEESIARAKNWILKNTVQLPDGGAYLPYCPGASREVMVYNGVSFGAGALAGALRALPDSPGVEETIRAYVQYLASQMSIDPNLAGAFWFYSAVQTPGVTRRVDYYHQAQQVDCHLFAQRHCPDATQEKMIRDATLHLLAIADKYPIVPYYSNDTGPSGKVAVWGLASVVPALLRASEQLKVEPQRARAIALRQLDWLIEKSWTGRHFYEVIHLDGSRGHEGYAFYNPRSDAWVFEALAVAYLFTKNEAYFKLARQVHDRLAAVNFSGHESHAITPGKRAVYWVSRKISRRR
jgi:hypothetical protein